MVLLVVVAEMMKTGAEKAGEVTTASEEREIRVMSGAEKGKKMIGEEVAVAPREETTGVEAIEVMIGIPEGQIGVMIGEEETPGEVGGTMTGKGAVEEMEMNGEEEGVAEVGEVVMTGEEVEMSGEEVEVVREVAMIGVAVGVALLVMTMETGKSRQPALVTVTDKNN